MASITLKDIPADLHAQLKQEADANYRSLNQEAMYRIARTFEIDAALTGKRDQRLIDEALASGPETGNKAPADTTPSNSASVSATHHP